MTEHEPEELYDALRRKLKDYGDQPPEEVWAGIRQQLPPLAAAPASRWQLRSRRKQAAAVLLLLLVGFCSVWWLLQPGSKLLTDIPVASARTSADQQPATDAYSRTPGAKRQPAAGVAETAAPNYSGRSVTALPQTTSSQPVRANDAALPSPGSVSSNPESVTSRHVASAAARPGAPQSTAVLGGKNVPSSVVKENKGPQPSVASAQTLLPTDSLRQDNGKSVAAASTARQPSSPGLPGTRRPTAVATEPAGSTLSVVQSQAGKAGGSLATTKTVAPINQPVGYAAGGHATGTTTAAVSSEALLVPRAVALGLGAWAAPTMQTVAGLAVPPPVPARSRWEMQAAAGPALTYRSLKAGSSPLAVGRFERPGLGYQAQVLAGYRLTPRLKLAAGAGFAEYASNLNLLVQHNSRFDSLRTTKHLEQRDVYRYFTLPVQAYYALGAPRSRFSYSLVGGATLGLYAGGRTTSGSACACEQQTWNSTNSPYRRISLGLTAGAEVRYQLAPRWALSAQPTFYYSLLSITKLNQPARYPFAAGLLTGFTYTLR